MPKGYRPKSVNRCMGCGSESKAILCPACQGSTVRRPLQSDGKWRERCGETVESCEYCQEWRDDCNDLAMERDEFRAEIDRLRDQIRECEAVGLARGQEIDRLRSYQRTVCDRAGCGKTVMYGESVRLLDVTNYRLCDRCARDFERNSDVVQLNIVKRAIEIETSSSIWHKPLTTAESERLSMVKEGHNQVCIDFVDKWIAEGVQGDQSSDS